MDDRRATREVVGVAVAKQLLLNKQLSNKQL